MRVMPAAGLFPRRGVVAFGWVMFGSIVLLVLILAVAVTLMGRHHKVELQNAVDAAALAGAQALADDLVFTEDPEAREKLTDSVRRAALALAARNRVRGAPLELDRNDENAIDGEIVVGAVDGAFQHVFTIRTSEPLDLYHPDLNVVRVAVRNGPAAASGTALADRDVLGFRATLRAEEPPATTFPTAPPAEPSPLWGLPLAPLAVFTDPVQRQAGSWEKEIIDRQGGDAWAFDAATRQPKAVSDGIPEITVQIGNDGNGRILRLGDPLHAAGSGLDRQDLLRQVETGVGYDDLEVRGGQPTGGQLLLWDRARQPETDPNRLALPEWTEGTQDADSRQALAASLARIVGQPRVWVLYSETWKDGQDRPWAAAVGFVAARVLAVDYDANGGTLAVVLQPTALNVAGAVTDTSRRDQGPRGLYNPTLARVRVVE